MTGIFIPILFVFLNFGCSQSQKAESVAEEKTTEYYNKNKSLADTTISAEVIYRSG